MRRIDCPYCTASFFDADAFASHVRDEQAAQRNHVALQLWRGECGHHWLKSESEDCPICALNVRRVEPTGGILDRLAAAEIQATPEYAGLYADAAREIRYRREAWEGADKHVRELEAQIEMLNARLDWTVNDNAKKAILIADQHTHLCDLIYAGNRIARAMQDSPSRRDDLTVAWYQAVEQAIPEHAKPTICKRETNDDFSST